MREIENLWIPLKDGRKVAARVWLPDSSAPAPAVFEWLPYRKRDGTAVRDEVTYPFLAARGFAGVRADIPGNGDSDGLMADEYAPDEIAVGREVAEWIAAQEWCDGKVGMIGISWGGFNGLQVGMTRPPSLKAVVTVASAVDRFADDIHFKGGCPLTDNAGWSAQMLAYSSRPPDPLIVGGRWREMWRERLEKMPLLAAEWHRHTRRDSYWKHGSLCEDWNSLSAPTLAVGGWADLYVNTPPQIAEKLSVPAKALTGPWEHKYPHLAQVGPRGDFLGEAARWFGRWLKGEGNGAESLPAWRAFIAEYSPPSEQYGTANGRWVAEQQWPSPNISEFVLHPGGGKLSESPGSGTAEIQSSPALGAAGGALCAGMRIDGELPGDQRGDDALSLCFDRELDSPLEILGRPRLEIAFSADRPVAFVVARLCEVAPDDSSARVSFGMLNLAHRESAEFPAPLVPGREYRATVLLDHCGRRFARGNRIRLALSADYWPMMWPAPEAAAVKLNLAECKLILPRRKTTGGEIESPPPPPVAAPAREVLRPPQSRRERGTTPDGKVFREEFDDFGKVRDPSHGLETESAVSQRFEIRPSDPSSASFRAEWTFGLSRGDGWKVRTESGHAMRADAGRFYIRAWLRAFDGGKLLVEREWDEAIPRDLI